MTVMDGDDMQRLWSLIEDLTNQLQANRQLCESLQQQADQLRGQAIHSGTGFALRRFNTDLSKEKFESELEALNAHLVKENLSLSQESKQQAMLLREYENTLETVMAKFRSFSHSTQQHTLQLTSHYESLLAQTTHNAAEQTLAAETAFSGTLTHLGGLVRRAMQSLDGEGSDDEEDGEGQEEGGRPRKSKRSGWVQEQKWYGSGGYTGKTTDPVALRADEALEQLTEEERLRMENDTLRELLGLKEKSDALLSTASGADGAAPAGTSAVPESKPLSPAQRRASLTVDEAAIAAEASGQPPLKALQVSSIIRPGDEAAETSPAAAAPTARASPKLTPSALERKDQIIEEAILADDENITDRGRRGSESAPYTIADSSAPPTNEGSSSSSLASLPVVFSGDEADTAPSSIQELRAAAAEKPAETSQVHATLPGQAESAAAPGGDADEITPIDEVSSNAEPNMVAEAAPPALTSTGIEDSDATVTSASGTEVGESTSASSSTTTGASTSDTAESSASSEAFSLSSVQKGTAELTESSKDAATLGTESAPAADSIEGDFKPVITSAVSDAATLSSDAPSPTDGKPQISIPAEPAKADNESVSPTKAVEATLTGEKMDDSEAAVPNNKGAKTTAPNTPGTPTQGQGRKDGSSSPNKKNRNRGKGNRHNKSNSAASNKG